MGIDEEIIVSIRQLAEYGKLKDIPRFVGEAAETWAVEHSALKGALDKIDAMQKTIEQMGTALRCASDLMPPLRDRAPNR